MPNLCDRVDQARIMEHPVDVWKRSHCMKWFHFYSFNIHRCFHCCIELAIFRCKSISISTSSSLFTFFTCSHHPLLGPNTSADCFSIALSFDFFLSFILWNRIIKDFKCWKIDGYDIVLANFFFFLKHYYCSHLNWLSLALSLLV